MLAWGFILLGSLAWLGAAQPIDSDVGSQWLVRERRSPMAARTMILIRGQPSGGGYQYERPARAFNPQAAMAAYATGGTVAAGTFYRSPAKTQECGDCNKSAEEQPEAPQPEEESKSAEEPAPHELEVPAQVDDNKTPAVPERKPKAKVPKRKPVVEDEDDDDDEDDSVARKGGKTRGSVYKNFFPVTFGAAGGSRSRDAEGGEGAGEGGGRVSVTAIANSFSKGRGAIASSSAVAHGNPAEASQTRQSQPSRYRSRA